VHAPGFEQFLEFFDSYAPYAGMIRIRFKAFDLSRRGGTPVFMSSTLYRTAADCQVRKLISPEQQVDSSS
jgi:hypothetical protein